MNKLLPVRILLSLVAWLIAALAVLAQLPLPETPTGLTATVAETSVQLSWQPAANASIYSVLLSSKGTNGPFLMQFTTTNTTASLSELEPNVRYAASIVAENVFGKGTNSEPVLFVPYSLLEVEQASAEALTDLLVGNGVIISNFRFTGNPQAVGTFNKGLRAGLDFDTGIILASGDIINAVGPNLAHDTTTQLGTLGDVDLSILLYEPGKNSNTNTFDAAIFEFDLVTTNTTVAFDFVFASEEYPEYVNMGFNDVFAVFINGTNAATINGVSNRVSIDSINAHTNVNLYVANAEGTNYPGIEYDGFTRRLIASATVIPNATNRIKLAIADVGDGAYDSALLIRAHAFVANPPPPPVFTVAKPLNGAARIEWLPSDGAFGYILKRGLSSAGPFQQIATLAAASFVDSGLLAGTNYVYLVEATNVFGYSGNSIPTNVIPGGIQIDQQPTNLTVLLGQNATFTAEVSGNGPIYYQWWFNDAPIDGSIGSSLVFASAEMANDGYYRLVATNDFGEVATKLVRLTIIHPDRPVFSFISPPLATNDFGDQVVLQAGVTGAQPMRYQWFHKGKLIPYADQPVYSISFFLPEDTGPYYFIAYNDYGAVTSSIARLYGLPMEVAVDKVYATVDCWADVPFNISIHRGTPPFTISCPEAGITGFTQSLQQASLLITNVLFPQFGFPPSAAVPSVFTNSYTVRVTDADGTTIDTSVHIGVRNPQPRIPDWVADDNMSSPTAPRNPLSRTYHLELVEGQAASPVSLVSFGVPHLGYSGNFVAKLV